MKSVGPVFHLKEKMFPHNKYKNLTELYLGQGLPQRII